MFSDDGQIRTSGPHPKYDNYRIILTPATGPLTAVRVAAFPDELKNQTIVNILGDGSLRGELEHQISSADLAERIHIRGHQSNVTDWMANADVLVLPSAWEGLPNVVLDIACSIVLYIAIFM